MEPIKITVYNGILNGEQDVVETFVRLALDQGLPAQEILNESMIAAMNEVGARFERGEIYLPEMLISAQAMKTGLAILKPSLVESDVKVTGRVAIGTVQGDLHEIGKNLVAMMLTGAGFEVIDLGCDVNPMKFVEIADKADVIALSALLTTTMLRIADTIEALKQAGKRDRVKVIIGGAPITAGYAQQVGADGYAPDASRAVALTRTLLKK